MSDYEIAIIGGGGAGLTSALYAGRAGRKTVVFEQMITGGQIATTSLVENYPGFPEGVDGFELAQSMLKQAEKFGAEVRYEGVETLVRRDDGLFALGVGDRTITAKVVIVTAGAAYNHLGVPGEERLTGHGVSYCATCDGAFFKGQDVIVVGGGDAALDEGLFLTRLVRGVTVVHRRDSFRASKVLQDRAMADPKFSFVWDSVVEEILGTDSVTGVRVKNLKTGEINEMPTAAVFIFIGQTPNNHLLKGLVELDSGGHALVDLRMQTNVPGLFVAGDLRAQAARQLVAACGDGSTAAISAERYLADGDE
ncbi:MAG: thioredoxin-disulfide reductase [Tepidiformaceae bacterium]